MWTKLTLAFPGMHFSGGLGSARLVAGLVFKGVFNPKIYDFFTAMSWNSNTAKLPLIKAV